MYKIFQSVILRQQSCWSSLWASLPVWPILHFYLYISRNTNANSRSANTAIWLKCSFFLFKRKLNRSNLANKKLLFCRHDMAASSNDHLDTASKQQSGSCDGLHQTTIRQLWWYRHYKLLQRWDDQFRNLYLPYTIWRYRRYLSMQYWQDATIAGNPKRMLALFCPMHWKMHCMLCRTWLFLNRMITLTISEKNAHLLIQVENTIEKPPKFIDGIPISETPGHGIGVRSIIYYVEKLGRTVPLFCIRQLLYPSNYHLTNERKRTLWK